MRAVQSRQPEEQLRRRESDAARELRGALITVREVVVAWPGGRVRGYVEHCGADGRVRDGLGWPRACSLCRWGWGHRCAGLIFMSRWMGIPWPRHRYGSGCRWCWSGSCRSRFETCRTSTAVIRFAAYPTSKECPDERLAVQGQA